MEDKSYRSAAELVREGLDNVIVLKTFSKIFAMAGLRLGFAYAAPERVKKVHDTLLMTSSRIRRPLKRLWLK